MKPEDKQEAYERWRAEQARRNPKPSMPIEARVVVEDPQAMEPALPTEQEEARRQNRERYPELAAFFDDCRRYFGMDVAITSIQDSSPNSSH